MYPPLYSFITLILLVVILIAIAIAIVVVTAPALIMSSAFDLKDDLQPHLPIVAMADRNEQDTPMNHTEDAKNADGPKNTRLRRRTQEYFEKRKDKANRAEKKKQKRRHLMGVQAALPANPSATVRPEFKLVKSMGLLCDTIKDAIRAGFLFPDHATIEHEFIKDEEADNLCGALHLQGTHNLDTARVQCFMLALLQACRNSGSQYQKPASEASNRFFFQAVADMIHEKGVRGGGLTPETFSMASITPATCQAMTELFTTARKAYLRSLVETKTAQEAVYTKRVKDLVRLADYWINFTKDVQMVQGEEELADALDHAAM
ncbi:hypothetical protein CkaCkLH20_05274 [Colletotrichum karsti]|uniref:Uncharacterized protein n=1 Tax=Colletotrichum karsti TaxID=1095194 RepID=A0A9P6I5Z1_9PEZI|nr:uncharacterized protein CkaCkLH20_05274 [Colletotrichum karsti]KAF9877008.1 hypothetical protein CkaCkLH20_05274 [Colletotrichum karsti]